MYIPLVRMVKFKFLAQLPVDHLPYPVMPCLIRFCANFQHSLFKWLIVSSLKAFAILLLFICINFNVIVPYGVFFSTIRRHWASFLMFPFLAITKFSRVIFRFYFAWNIHTFFSYNFCSLVIAVLLIIVLFVLFLVAVISLSWFFYLRH